MKAGVIGLGAMGQPMAVNLASAGYLHRLWNRNHDKAKTLSQAINVPAVHDLQTLARDCDVLFTCVSADQDLLEVIQGLEPELNSSQIIIDTSTVSPATAIEVQKRLGSIQVEFLDAPVSGGVEGAKNAQLVMMVGGKRTVFDAVRPLLDSISRKQIYLGEAGSGQACKAVNQLMAAGINQAVSESLAFAQALNLDLDKVIEAVNAGAAANWFLQNRGQSMANNQFDPGFRLALHYKDLSICRELAESCTAVDTRLPLIEMTMIHYRRLMQQELGDQDISALFKLKQQLFNSD